MKRSINLFISDILENIVLIEESTNKIKKEGLSLDRDLRDATVRRLEIIGEAVKNIPDSFRKLYPNVSWRKIAGFRDIVIHAYFRIDTDIIWNIIKEDIPDLKRKIIKIKRDLEK